MFKMSKDNSSKCAVKPFKSLSLNNRFSVLSFGTDSETDSGTDTDPDPNPDSTVTTVEVKLPKSISSIITNTEIPTTSNKVIEFKCSVKYVDLTIPEKKRCFTCCLCENGSTHNLRKCPNYMKCKNDINKYNYIDIELKSKDKAGFCAGGIIPFCTDEFGEKYMLMIVENRADGYTNASKDIPGLNFIAGGRECITDKVTNITVPETPYQTAINEFKEELGEILTSDSFELIKSEVENKEPSFIFWSGQSKMVLFGVNVSYHLYNNLILDDNSKKTTEAENFKWIKISEYDRYIYGSETNDKDDLHYHRFTRQIIYPIVTHISKY